MWERIRQWFSPDVVLHFDDGSKLKLTVEQALKLGVLKESKRTKPMGRKSEKVLWKVWNLTIGERQVIEDVVRSNPDKYDLEIEKEDDETGETKVRLLAVSAHWLEFAWRERMKHYWSAEMLKSALRLQQASHPEC